MTVTTLVAESALTRLMEFTRYFGVVSCGQLVAERAILSLGTIALHEEMTYGLGSGLGSSLGLCFAFGFRLRVSL